MKNDFEIRGEITAIFLRRRSGEIIETIIDTDQLHLVQAIPYRFSVIRWGKTQNYYAIVSLPKEKGLRSRQIGLHRLILGDPKGLHVDHINHNTLDNRSSNLRPATNAENQQNRTGAQSNNTGCKYRGVNYKKRWNNWHARLRLNGKQYSFGYYSTPEEANEVIKRERGSLMPFSNEGRLI